MKIINIQRHYKTTALAESSNEGAFYRLVFEHGKFTCSCPQFKNKHVECKHIIQFKQELEYIKSMKVEQ